MSVRPLDVSHLTTGQITTAGSRVAGRLRKAAAGRVIRLRPAGTQVPPALTDGAWGYFARVYIAFDAPSAPLPNWIEITGYVDWAKTLLRIAHGRNDGLSDVNPGTLALTVDNSDGRFTPKLATSPWAGLFRKNNWLRVDVVPPSGNTSTRFNGFIQTVTVFWEGQQCFATLGCSDRLALIQALPNLREMITSETLTDTSANHALQGCWPLHDPATGPSGLATKAAADVSGGSLGALALSLIPGTPPNATVVSFANQAAPGFDGAQTLDFTPQSASAGAYFAGTVNTAQNAGYTFGEFTIEFWVMTTTVLVNDNPICSVYDAQVAQQAIAIVIAGSSKGVDAGNLGIVSNVTTPGSSAPTDTLYYNTNTAGGNSPPLNDGLWHHVVVTLGPSSGNPSFPTYVYAALDGVVQVNTIYGFTTGMTLANLTVGAGHSVNSRGQLATFYGAISDFSYCSGSGGNYLNRYRAGTTGFSGESTDARIARVARYAGIPYSPVTGTPGPWTNLRTGAHPVGPQQTSGRSPLDVMREAARTEFSPLYVDRAGYLAMLPSTARNNPAPAWSVNALDLLPGTQQVDDFTYTANQTTITPNGQAQQVINTNGTASQALYGLYGQSQSTASLNLVEAASLGAAVNFFGADPPPRPTPIVLEAATMLGQGTGGVAVLGSPNPTMALGTSWAAFGGTLAYSTTVLYPGQSWSGLLTPSGVASQSYLESGRRLVTAGVTYTAGTWVYSPTGYSNIGASINWYDAAGNYLTTSSGTGTAVAAGTWTYLSTSAVNNIAGAVRATIVVVQGGTPPASALLYVASGNLYDPTYSNAWYDAVLAADVNTPIAVVGMPAQAYTNTSLPGTPGAGAPVGQASVGAMVMYIEGWSEEIGEGTHTFTYTTTWGQAPTWMLDSPTLGLVDTAGITLAY